MENQIRNADTPARPAAKGTNVAELKQKAESPEEPFRPKPTLLLNVLPPQGAKPAGARQSGAAAEKPEESLQYLLINTESSARRTQSAKTEWQLASLVMAMLLAATAVIIGWLYFEVNSTRTKQGRLTMENQSLKDQLNSTTAQIAGFKNEIETLLSRNLELAGENSQLKSQKQTAATTGAFAVKPEQKTVAVKTASAARQTPALNRSGSVPDAGRIEAIKKGTFPKGATKDELTTVLGEPDRIYKSRGYEQYVYFGQKPARFWFFANHLVQTSG
jgi:regulator of replication initiation timing